MTHPPKPSVNGLETFDTQSDFVPQKKSPQAGQEPEGESWTQAGQNLRLLLFSFVHHESQLIA